MPTPPGATRRPVKAAVEALLVRSGLARIRRRLLFGERTVVLAYHDVVPDGEPVDGDPSLHLPLSRFLDQVDHLAETCRVVGFGEAVAPDGDDGGRPGRPRVAITFDDAYRGALALAIPELVRRRMPATVFVAPGLLGHRALWWDRLGPVLSAPDGRELRRRALAEHRGDPEAVVRWAREEGWPLADPGRWCRTASEEELREAAELPGIALGSHGWDHLNLTALEEEELRAELERPSRWLADRFSSFGPWLAYPYGLASAREERAAAGAGYELALRVEGGWLPVGPPEPHAVPRLNVPAGLSPHGFRLRMAGLFAR